jgi:prevent-host-death family protein
MKTASVSELKAHLSKYLRVARRGGEVQVLDRGVPIARIVPCQPGSEAQPERLDRLVRAGIVRRGTGDLAWLVRDPPVRVPGAALSRALDEDREDRA